MFKEDSKKSPKDLVPEPNCGVRFHKAARETDPDLDEHGHAYGTLRSAATAQSGPPEAIRKFETGATRDKLGNKFQVEGYLSPRVLQRYAEFMKKHQTQKDGSVRAPDNWQQGIPVPVYMDSLIRHVLDIWLYNRGEEMSVEGEAAGYEDALCAVIFNAMGLLFEETK